MAITGGVKFFLKSQCLAKDGTTIAATSGNDAAPYVLDLNPDTRWRSVGSTDANTQQMQIDFTIPTRVSRILIVDHNLKQFQVKYDVAGVWTSFSNVKGIDGARTGISETAFHDDTAYYEFDEVTTSSILISMDKTQVVDDEKYMNQVVVTREIGTLQGYPTVKKLTVSKNSRIQQTISGKFSVQKSVETASFAMTFKDYPSETTYGPDMDVMMTLHDSQDPFLVWMCGGRRGANYFRYTLRGWRLKDIYQMQVTKPFDVFYTNNIYQGGLNNLVQLDEHI
jgi:hypothetical protein